MRSPILFAAVLAAAPLSPLAVPAPLAQVVRPPEVSVPARTARPAARASATLTPQGYGPVRIGMTRAQVNRALRETLTPRSEWEEDACESGTAASLPGMIFMFEDGRLTRISLYEESAVRTPRGLGIGSTEAEVRRLYPGLEEEEHTYVGAPGLYLTYWVTPKKRGVRFETNSERKVSAVHAGLDSITYIEGCL